MRRKASRFIALKVFAVLVPIALCFACSWLVSGTFRGAILANTSIRWDLEDQDDLQGVDGAQAYCRAPFMRHDLYFTCSADRVFVPDERGHAAECDDIATIHVYASDEDAANSEHEIASWLITLSRHYKPRPGL